MPSVGNFTSSQIYKLMTVSTDKKSLGKPALTYIEEKRMELRLGRSLQKENGSYECSWGKLVEKRAFDLLDTSYELVSADRLNHPTLLHWTGTPDFLKDEDTVGDIKCPFTLKSFCTTVDVFPIAEKVKVVKPEYYWQLVSNSILTGRDVAELVVYVPFFSELAEIKTMAWQSEDDLKVDWLKWISDDELPYLMDFGHYTNKNILRFEVPKEDKELLTETVKKATELLIK